MKDAVIADIKFLFSIYKKLNYYQDYLIQQNFLLFTIFWSTNPQFSPSPVKSLSVSWQKKQKEKERRVCSNSLNNYISKWWTIISKKSSKWKRQSILVEKKKSKIKKKSYNNNFILVKKLRKKFIKPNVLNDNKWEVTVTKNNLILFSNSNTSSHYYQSKNSTNQ